MRPWCTQRLSSCCYNPSSATETILPQSTCYWTGEFTTADNFAHKVGTETKYIARGEGVLRGRETTSWKEWDGRTWRWRVNKRLERSELWNATTKRINISNSLPEFFQMSVESIRRRERKQRLKKKLGHCLVRIVLQYVLEGKSNNLLKL